MDSGSTQTYIPFKPKQAFEQNPRWNKRVLLPSKNAPLTSYMLETFLWFFFKLYLSLLPHPRGKYLIYGPSNGWLKEVGEEKSKDDVSAHDGDASQMNLWDKSKSTLVQSDKVNKNYFI